MGFRPEDCRRLPGSICSSTCTKICKSLGIHALDGGDPDLSECMYYLCAI